MGTTWFKRLRQTAAVLLVSGVTACGPVPPPANPYSIAMDIISDMSTLRGATKSFRIAGTVDHLGKQRIQGKAFLFGELPDRLRVDLLSPFGTTLSVLTAQGGQFGLSDHREGRYFQGPAQPCNIARLVGIALPAEDVIRILLGHTPLIDGPGEVSWDGDGFYRVSLSSGTMTQVLEIGSDRNTLPLQRSVLLDSGKTVYEIVYSQWQSVGERVIPFEIRVRMPAEKSELIVRYDANAVEFDVSLPSDAWEQRFPTGVKIENVTCD
jgi:hypothetical protein